MVSLAGYNIGTVVSGCNFVDSAGMAIKFTGARNEIKDNYFSNCVREIHDWGAVYGGRSLIQIGNKITANVFDGILWRGRSENVAGQTVKVEGTFEDDVAGVMLDDYMCGTTVEYNTFSNCQTAIIHNGGRFNLFSHNIFGSPIYKNALRTTAGGALYNDVRIHNLAEPDKASAWSQRWYEFRNLVNSANGTAFLGQGGWATVMSQGAYAGQPGGIGAQNDLLHLVSKLDAYMAANPFVTSQEWRNVETVESFEYFNSNLNLDVLIPNWFHQATGGTLAGTPSPRRYGLDYTLPDPGEVPTHTRMQNAGNIFRWTVGEFASGIQEPWETNQRAWDAFPEVNNPPSQGGYNSATRAGYFRQRIGNSSMQDPEGYYSHYDPETVGN